MSPKRQHRKRDPDAFERWLDRAPLLSAIHCFLLFGIGLAILQFASDLMIQQVISDSTFYLLAFFIFAIVLICFFMSGMRGHRKLHPTDEVFHCETCHRVITYRQRKRTQDRFPDKHFQELCQRCRDIVFQQASWDQQRKALHRGVLPFFVLFSLACIANMVFAIVSPVPGTLREGLVEAQLQVLRFQQNHRMLEAIYQKQEVSFYLPKDVDLQQQLSAADLQQGDIVTALVDDKRIVELSKDGQPIFTFDQVEHKENLAYVFFFIMAGLFATGPIGWYLYWERPRAAQLLQTYREKMDKYPQEMREQLAARTRS